MLLRHAAVLVLLLCGMVQPAWAEERWITHPQALTDPGKPIALHFRREIELGRLPARAVVQVSADNRFVLLVNGRRVASGPARGDLRHWRYRSVDLAPFLKRGSNVIAAQVWNDGQAAALAQVSARTGFFLRPMDPQLALLESGPAWRVRVDTSRTVAPALPQIMGILGLDRYYAAAPPETHDAAARRGDWLARSTSAPDWVAAADALPAGQATPWTLVEDRLPPMIYQPLPGGKLVRAGQVAGSPFPDGPVTVPANTTATLLLDAGRVQAAYPELNVSGGRGAEIGLTYTEAMYGPDKTYLTNRAQVTGGQAFGLVDIFRPDGSSGSVYQPFWWRTWRFVELRVKTGAEPVRLERFARYATGYPFTLRARFESSDRELNRIWQIGWDTVQLDAHETFMDTAYWEQLQYIGDTRIEALVSYLASGDARLGVQAIEAFDDSRVDGLPQSRWPSKEPQSIPPFALLWVGMLHDHWLYQSDRAPLRRSLPGARSVLEWYGRHVAADGLVGTTPGWEFIDWRPTLSNAPWAKDKPETDRCIVTLLYIGALKQAADLEGDLGEAERARSNRTAADRLSQAVNERCWSAERGLYADTPGKAQFSQHANALAVLYDVAPKAAQVGILDRITVRNDGIAAPDGVTGATYYFAYYLVRALDHAGLDDRYLELLRTWRGMLAQNFTTWPEEPDPTRSDSHAWSAHPTADLLRIVAGIQPASPGFATVRVAPHLGSLRSLDAALAHPAGLIEVRYDRRRGKLAAVIVLPATVGGEFVWNGQRVPLRGGTNRVTLADQVVPD